MEINWKGTLFKNEPLRKTIVGLVIVGIFLSLFLFFFNMFQASVIQSLSQINNEFVEQVNMISGTLLEIINNTAMQMFYSRSLKTLRTSTTLTNAERIAGTRDLGNWVMSSTFLSDAKIYNALTDTIFTSNGDYVENASTSYPNRAVADLLIARTRHGSEGPVKRSTSQGDAYSFLFFEPSIPSSGSLLLTVRAEWYEKQLLGIASGQDIIILNEEGDILVAGDAETAQALSQAWPSLLESFSTAKVPGLYLEKNGQTGWMYHELSNLGLYYLRAFDTETAFPGITKTRNFVFVLLSFISLLLLGGILYTLFELYMPIREVQQVLAQAGTIDGGLAKQVDRLLSTQKEQQKSQQIEKLIRGQEVNLLGYPSALILTEATDSFIIEERLTAETSHPFVVAKASLGTIVLVKTGLEEEVFNLCISITDATNSRCFYGFPRNSGEELAVSHNNLLELWQLRFLYVGQQILSERLIHNSNPTLDFHTKDTEPLFSALRAGQLDEARENWKNIFNRIRQGRFADFRFYTHYILRYLKTLESEVGLEPLPWPENFLMDLEDVADLHKALDTLFRRITDKQNEKRKQNLSQLADRVNHRLAVGFADDALSAQRIAEEMGMNSTYLGRLYRESTGVSISEALKQTRIENAKKLLQTTSHTVKDIALEVGFSNTKYFYVVFRESVGMTPSEFREEANV